MGRIRICVAVVQRRLAGVKVLIVISVTRIFALHPFTQGVLHIVRILEHCFKIPLSLCVRQTVGPDIIVRILKIAVLRALQEPGMLVGRVSGNEVKHHLDSPCVSLFNKFHKVVVGTETWIHAIEVNHVVSAVNPAGNKKRIEPYRPDSEALYIVQFGNDTADIAYSVAVGVLVGGWINLIDHTVL